MLQFSVCNKKKVQSKKLHAAWVVVQTSVTFLSYKARARVSVTASARWHEAMRLTSVVMFQ